MLSNINCTKISVARDAPKYFFHYIKYIFNKSLACYYHSSSCGFGCSSFVFTNKKGW